MGVSEKLPSALECAEALYIDTCEHPHQGSIGLCGCCVEELIRARDEAMMMNGVERGLTAACALLRDFDFGYAPENFHAAKVWTNPIELVVERMLADPDRLREIVKGGGDE
jgi:hypothetical protein